MATPKTKKSENMSIWTNPEIWLFLWIRFLNFFFIPVVQEYLNEIAPTIYGPNKLKTSGKPLRIADKQTPASGQDNPATLYIWRVSSVFLIHEKSSSCSCLQCSGIWVSCLLWKSDVFENYVEKDIRRYCYLYFKKTCYDFIDAVNECSVKNNFCP